MDKNIGKNILYTSVSGIIQAILTLLFWLVTAKTVDITTIGLVSAIISFVTIVTTINGLNMSFGMKRALGISISINDLGKFKQFLVSTIVFVSITITISCLLISIPNLKILELIGIDHQYAWIIIAIIPAMAFQFVFSEALVSAHRSQNLVLPVLTGSLLRFPVLLTSVYLFNAPTIGTIIAYSLVLFISAGTYGVYLAKIFKGISVKSTENIISNIKHLINASLVSWGPQMLSVIGSQLSILAVFAIGGSSEGGKFYIPLTIFSISLFLVAGINRVSHPLIAGMEDKQQVNFLTYTTRIAFVFTVPLVMPLLFFANDFLGLLGEEFASAASSLNILMIGFQISIINEMIYYFVYGRGDHKSVLYLGLVGTISKIALYFTLVPIFSGNGAALSILIGSIAQLVLSIRVGKKHSLIMQYKKYFILTVIPLAIGFILWKAEVNFIISSIIIFFSSLLIYVRFKFFTEEDLRNTVFTVLPQNSAETIYPILLKILQKIN